jgi:hypothetical protein
MKGVAPQTAVTHRPRTTKPVNRVPLSRLPAPTHFVRAESAHCPPLPECHEAARPPATDASDPGHLTELPSTSISGRLTPWSGVTFGNNTNSRLAPSIPHSALFLRPSALTARADSNWWAGPAGPISSCSSPFHCVGLFWAFQLPGPPIAAHQAATVDSSHFYQPEPFIVQRHGPPGRSRVPDAGTVACGRSLSDPSNTKSSSKTNDVISSAEEDGQSQETTTSSSSSRIHPPTGLMCCTPMQMASAPLLGGRGPFPFSQPLAGRI